MAVVNPRRIDPDDLDRVVQDFTASYPSGVEVTPNLDGSATLRASEGTKRMYARVNADGVITTQDHYHVQED